MPVSLGIAGLLPETTYYFQALASNAVATARGELLSFTTLLAPATENHAPVAVNDTLGGAKNTSSTIAATVFTANDTDADGDALSVTAVTYTGDHGGAVALSGANITYSPAADYAGSDAFTYTISDGHGGTAVGTVAVTVSTSSPGSPNAGGIVADGAKFKLTFQGVGNRTYRVQYATRLTPPDWQDLGTVQASRTGLVLYEDTPPSGASARYYRIVHP